MTELKKHGSFDTVKAIFDHYEQSNPVESQFRGHLGASVIGKPCDREIWYVFNWAVSSNFTGRLYRLFETGEREEERLVRNLRDVGVEVHEVDPNTGDQFRALGFGGHFGGSFDGVAKGLKEAPKTWHVLEFKTASSWAFDRIKKLGCLAEKPEHFAQMQIYMGAAGLKDAFYLVRNKNNEELYSERIKFKSAVYNELLRKAERIIFSRKPPARNESDSNCKYCRAKDVCIGRHEPYRKHMKHYKLAARNCRTCLHVKPVDSLPDQDGLKVMSEQGYDHTKGGYGFATWKAMN